jgi:hypothetical protein
MIFTARGRQAAGGGLAIVESTTFSTKGRLTA